MGRSHCSTPIDPTPAAALRDSCIINRERQSTVLRAVWNANFPDVLIDEHETEFMTWIARKPSIFNNLAFLTWLDCRQPIKSS